MPTKKEYLSTVEKIVSPPEEGTGTGSWCQEIRSNAMVVGNQNSQFMYNQSTDGPYQELSKSSSYKNKYITKIASNFNHHIPKFGLGISGASLAVSLANYHNSSITAKANTAKVNLEHKSLNTLNQINKALTPAQLHPSPVSTNTDRKKI